MFDRRKFDLTIAAKYSSPNDGLTLQGKVEAWDKVSITFQKFEIEKKNTEKCT
jgi:hypothetical protein